MIRTTARRLLKHEKQRDHGKRRDHQQLVIVDVSNDLRLLRDHGVERGTASGGQRIPELCDRWALQRPVQRRYVLRDVGGIRLRITDQQSVHYRDADARADVAREIVEAGALGLAARRESQGRCPEPLRPRRSPTVRCPASSRS